MKGLEPTRLSAPDPKSGAATNYATSAFDHPMIFQNEGANILLFEVYPFIYQNYIDQTGRKFIQ